MAVVVIVVMRCICLFQQCFKFPDPYMSLEARIDTFLNTILFPSLMMLIR